MKKLVLQYKDLLVLTLIAIPVGAAVGAVDAVFGRILISITAFRMAHPYWLLPFLGIVGAAIIRFYQKYGGESQKGMALIFEAGHGTAKDIPLRLIPLTIVGTWLTHLFGGSAGREGVAIQIGGTLAHGVGKRLRIENAGKIMLIAGMAAGFAGLFRTPIAATFFALEVLTAGRLEHKAILPALTASYVAALTAKLLGLEKFTFLLTDRMTFSWSLAARLVLLGIVFGVTGGLFSAALRRTKKLFASLIPSPVLRIFLVGCAVGGLSLLCFGGRYSGLGTNLIGTSFASGVFPWDFALKFAFTVITLSAGFQGGEVTPLFSIGAALGAALSVILGLPPAFAAALGYAAVFGGATNTLIAPILIGAEVFGFAYLPYFFVVCTIAYAFNGNLSIYSGQKAI